MDRKITKKRFSISVDPELLKKMDNINNKSKYIECLIYQDLKKNNMDGIGRVMI